MVNVRFVLKISSHSLILMIKILHTVLNKKKLKFTNVAEKLISNKTKLPHQINLTTRYEDNITKDFQCEELSDLL